MSWQFDVTTYIYVLIAAQGDLQFSFFHNVVFDSSCNLIQLWQNLTINAVMHWTFNGLCIQVK